MSRNIQFTVDRGVVSATLDYVTLIATRFRPLVDPGEGQGDNAPTMQKVALSKCNFPLITAQFSFITP